MHPSKGSPYTGARFHQVNTAAQVPLVKGYKSGAIGVSIPGYQPRNGEEGHPRYTRFK